MSTQIDLGPVLSVPKGDWNADTTYEKLNMVRHNSAAWICNVATSKGVEPTEDSTDWYLQVKDTSSVTSVNGMKGDVVIELTETETPPTDDSSNRIATTEWVTGKLGDVDLSGIKDDTVLAAQNAGSLETGTGELTSAELATIIDNNDSTLRTLIAQEVAKYLPLTGGTMTGNILYDNTTEHIDLGYYYADKSGALLSLTSNNHSPSPGEFGLVARNSSNSASLNGYADGTLIWNGKQVVHTGFKLGYPVWIGTFNVGNTYTAPSLGLFTGRCGGGNSESGSLEVSGTNKIDFTCPDSGWGPLKMPITLVVGAGDVVKLVTGGVIYDARFIPFVM